MPRNFLSSLIAFARVIATRSHTAKSWWDKNGHRNDGKPATCLNLRDSIPRPPFREGYPALQITSEFQELLPEDFGPVAEKVNKVGMKGHGRTVTCLDRHDNPLAALSYHLPDAKTTPFMVGPIAMLILPGPGDDVVMSDWSRECVGVLLCYLVLASRELGYPDFLAMSPAPASRDLALSLGFVDGRPPAEYRIYTPYMTWRPPKSL